MTDEQIDSLLNKLDRAARDYNEFDYGLPLEGATKLRQIVREWIDAMAGDEAFIRELASKHPDGLHVS